VTTFVISDCDEEWDLEVESLRQVLKFAGLCGADPKGMFSLFYHSLGENVQGYDNWVSLLVWCAVLRLCEWCGGHADHFRVTVGIWEWSRLGLTKVEEGVELVEASSERVKWSMMISARLDIVFLWSWTFSRIWFGPKSPHMWYIYMYEQLKTQTEFGIHLTFSNLKMEMDLYLDLLLFYFWQCAFSVMNQFAPCLR